MTTGAPPVDFTGAAEFAPHQGSGGADLWPAEGFYAAKISDLTVGTSKSGNWKVKVNLVAEDADAKGCRGIKDVPYTGERRDGKKNVLGFMEFLHSSGTSLDQLRQLNDKKLDINQVIGQLKGRSCYVEVISDEYNGEARSEIRNFITAERYEQAKAINAHRRPNRVTKATAGMAAPANGAATTAATAL